MLCHFSVGLFYRNGRGLAMLQKSKEIQQQQRSSEVLKETRKK